jgi:hypothetical protein
MVLGPDSARK